MLSSNIANFSSDQFSLDFLCELNAFDHIYTNIHINFKIQPCSIFDDFFVTPFIFIKNEMKGNFEKFEFETDFDKLTSSYNYFIQNFKEFESIVNSYSLKVSSLIKNSILIKNFIPLLFNESDINYIVNKTIEDGYFKISYFTPKTTYSAYITDYLNQFEIQYNGIKKYISKEELIHILKSSFIDLDSFYFSDITDNQEIYNSQILIKKYMDEFRTKSNIENF